MTALPLFDDAPAPAEPPKRKKTRKSAADKAADAMANAAKYLDALEGGDGDGLTMSADEMFRPEMTREFGDPTEGLTDLEMMTNGYMALEKAVEMAAEVAEAGVRADHESGEKPLWTIRLETAALDAVERHIDAQSNSGATAAAWRGWVRAVNRADAKRGEELLLNRVLRRMSHFAAEVGCDPHRSLKCPKGVRARHIWALSKMRLDGDVRGDDLLIERGVHAPLRELE
ncbi:hypothetical protein CKO28_17555 [Rhodovibrio sodomensis]|uniref:Uncharacterized protein n=1 Tax=Rhodovibrio sodomensis TaxID=1088 RepID=A0ABS1DKG2_9PROT|nr:hypothetical protein [Rhodovibrio sodomensis]MBK1669845.1 hypothetical protein [Rhodovibrio sodomensis]